MRKTDFFIVGHSKSGTTALYHFLRQHPEVCMCEPKEPNVFATDLLHDANVGAFRRKTESEYAAMFRDETGVKLRGEASACYLYSQTAPYEIHRHNPDARLIAMLREPIDFLLSYHLQMLKNPISEGETEKNFAKALDLETDRKAGARLPRGCMVPRLLYYSDRVKYAEQLERLFKYFRRDQVKIIVYDDFKKDNEGVVTDVYRFLGVDARFVPTLGIFNEGARLRSKTLQNITNEISHGTSGFRTINRGVKLVLPKNARKVALRFALRHVAFGEKRDVRPKLRAALQAQYRDEVSKLSELLGRDLVREWGYT